MFILQSHLVGFETSDFSLSSQLWHWSIFLSVRANKRLHFSLPAALINFAESMCPFQLLLLLHFSFDHSLLLQKELVRPRSLKDFPGFPRLKLLQLFDVWTRAGWKLKFAKRRCGQFKPRNISLCYALHHSKPYIFNIFGRLKFFHIKSESPH